MINGGQLGNEEVSNQMKKDSRQQIGKLGEDAASGFLQQAGYSIRNRNWRCRSGEIDIVAEYAGRIVFVEVRTRKHEGRFGTAAESVDRRKQQQVRETAQVYLKSMKLSDHLIRFDVIAVTVDQNGLNHTCKHYESAF